MKTTTNVFLEGIQTDLHPLSTSQQVLTDALNATMLTYNGNEMMLLNDMGNTLIQDSATGNIMGLNPGFIPTGIKEHGGIMYITSVGKDDNGNPIGEIGTIPSPIIRDIYKDKITYNVNNFIPIGIGDPLTITHKLYPADKFIVNLDMKVDESSLIGTKHYKDSALSGNGGKPSGDPSDIVLSRKVVQWDGNSRSLINLYTPLISYSNPEVKNVKIPLIPNVPIEVPLFSTKGIYSLDMYSTNVNGSKKVSGPLTYPQLYNGGASKYWYLHNDEYESVFPKDLFEATLNKSLKQFPSSNKPGQLAVKLTPEKVGEFGMLPRKNDPKNTPITVKWGNPTTYISFFPGFYYSTESGVYIDKLNNIKVIDESTELEIGIVPSPNDPNDDNPLDRGMEWDGGDREIKFTNILHSPNYFLGQRWKWFDTQSVLWGDFELPQTLSQTSNNHFILSSLVDLTDHSLTDLVSSDSSDNKKHAGLFYANLGAKYNNWYRLELDYYDLYDNLQGSFSTRFNPYINDTFGTNLDITGVEMVDGIVMGSKKTYNSTINDFTLNSASQDAGTFSHSYPSINNTSWENLPGTPGRDLYAPDSNTVLMYDTDSKGFYCSGTLEKTFLEYSRIFKLDFEDVTATYSGEIKKNDTLNSFLYLYNTTDPVYLSIKELNELYRNYIDIWWKEGSLEPSAPHVVFAGSRNICGASEIPAQERWNKQKDVGILYIQYGLEEDTKITVDAKITSGGDSGLDPSIAPISVPMNITGSAYYLTKSIPNMVSFCVDSTTLREVIFGGQINAIASPINKIPLYLHLVQKGSYIHADDFKSILVMYLTSKNSSPRIRMMTALNLGINSGSMNMSIDLTPAYKITPYFLLTGTADSTSSVYPRRFVSYKKDNGQFNYIDMPYEYNLEKVPAAFGITSSKITVPNSSYLKELDGYNQDINKVKLTLDVGIYTLNITGVPNKLNSAASVQIDDTKLELYTTGTLHIDKATAIHNEFGFYQPVVFILEQRKDVEISASDLNAFQEIGLYKVNTVDKDSLSAFIDMYTEAGGAKICTYQEYINSLIKTIKDQEENKELLPSERYALIQKYGICFKEAYVFTEGLYNAKNKTINKVEIADSTNGNKLTYTATPYIPADTSILPVNLQGDDELTYTWNIYVMPDSILDTDYLDKNADIPEFVFTNGVPEKVPTSTAPKRGNLRRLTDQVFEIGDLLGDKLKDHFGNNNAIGGILPPVSIK